MRMQFKPKALLTMLILPALVACSSDDGGIMRQPGYEETEGKMEATISVEMPTPNDDYAASRAGENDIECDIQTLDGLVFDENGKFLERLPAANIVRDGNNVKITLLFDKIAKKRTVHLIANSRDMATGADRVDFSPMTEGTPEAQVKNLITKPMDQSQPGVQSRIMPPVMWGRIVLNNGITQNTSMNGGKLLRAVAAVTVKAADGTPENGLSEFVIEGATLLNPGATGFVTPTETVTAAPTANPTVARSTAVYGTDVENWFTYGTLPTLYTYERTCSNAAYMSVIIKAKYKGVSGYYKVLMTNASKTPYNIVRNHRYILTITKVTDRGYADLSTAVAALPCNTLRASIVESSGDFSGVAADQNYMLCLNCNTFELFGRFNNTSVSSTVDIATVKYTGPKTPTVRPAAQYPWLTNLRVIATGSQTFRITGDFVTDDASHEGDITIVGDNLELPVKVKWHLNDVDTQNAGVYSVRVVHPGETNWMVKVTAGQTSPVWFGMTNNNGVPSTVSNQSVYLTELSSRFNPGAWLHINKGQNNIARLHKTCAGPTDNPVSAEIAVVRHP